MQHNHHTQTNAYTTSYAHALRRPRRDSLSPLAISAAAVLTAGAFWENSTAGQLFSSFLIAVPIMYAIATLAMSLRLKLNALTVIGLAASGLLLVTTVHMMLSSARF